MRIQDSNSTDTSTILPPFAEDNSSVDKNNPSPALYNSKRFAQTATANQIEHIKTAPGRKRIIRMLAIILLMSIFAAFHPYTSLLFPAETAQSKQNVQADLPTVVSKKNTAVQTPQTPQPTNKRLPSKAIAPQIYLTLGYHKSIKATDLTSVGTIDWEQWGLHGAGDVNRKADVSPQISNYILLGGGSVGVDQHNPIDSSWSDGTPTSHVDATTSGIYATGGYDSGFKLTVPASATARTLWVYVGASQARGDFVARLGGKRLTSARLDMTNNPTQKAGNAVYIITFSSNVPEQLTVSYQEKSNDGSQAYVLLEAAALTGS